MFLKKKQLYFLLLHHLAGASRNRLRSLAALNQRRQTLLFGTGSINPNKHQRRAPEPLAAVSDCHSRRSGRSSSIST